MFASLETKVHPQRYVPFLPSSVMMSVRSSNSAEKAFTDEDPFLGEDRSSAIESLLSSPGNFDFPHCTKLFKNLWRLRNRHSFCTSFEKSNRRLQRHIPSQIGQLDLKAGLKVDGASQLSMPPTKLWRNAKNLYVPLSGRWLCECRQHHQVNLPLRNPNDDTDFQILLTYDDLPSRDSHPWSWLEIAIRALDKPELNENIPKLPDPPQLPESKTLPKPALTQSPQGKEETHLSHVMYYYQLPPCVPTAV